MILNFLKGKTEAIVTFAGPGARKAKVHLYKCLNCEVTFKVCGVERTLRFVDAYKHMGTMSCIGGNLSVEVASRSAVIHTESCRLSKVMATTALGVDRKVCVINCYVLSKGAFQCSTWDQLPYHLFKRFHHAVMGCYRKAHGQTNFDDMLNDDCFVYDNKLICPMTILRFSRLQLLLRVLRKAPAFFVNIIRDCSCLKGGWCAAILEDLRWLCMSCDYNGKTFRSVRCNDLDFGQWCDYFVTDLSLHAKRIKK